jgi:hypothetical protein
MEIPRSIYSKGEGFGFDDVFVQLLNRFLEILLLQLGEMNPHHTGLSILKTSDVDSYGFVNTDSRVYFVCLRKDRTLVFLQ